VTPGKKTGVLAIIEGVRFWAREDALNEEKNQLDPNVSSAYPDLSYLRRILILFRCFVPWRDWEA
jgi:hypothetical protein